MVLLIRCLYLAHTYMHNFHICHCSVGEVEFYVTSMYLISVASSRLSTYRLGLPWRRFQGSRILLAQLRRRTPGLTLLFVRCRRFESQGLVPVGLLEARK